VRLSAPYLKKELKTALSHRNAILNNSIRQKPAYVKREKPNLYGEDIKIVSKITRRPKFLTDAEKDGMVEKYKAGLTVKKIADLYGCCNSTVRKELRQRGVIN
jgi:DNA-binding NarL/FixJ family response regulator